MEPSAGIYARHSPYLDRYVRIGVVGTQLLAVDFPREAPADAGADHPILDAIERYLDGVEDDLGGVGVALTVDTTTRAVLDAVREIPYGQERDLATLTRLTPGIDPDDTAAVDAALAENPVPLVVPDHRIVGSRHGAPPVVVERLRALEGLDR